MSFPPIKIKSQRQMQIVRLASTGLTDKEIALQTGLAVGTLRTYWDRLRTRFGCKNRAELIATILSQEATEHSANTLLNALPLFIWKAGAEGSIQFRNSWFLKCSGESAEGIESYMQPKDREVYAKAWEVARDHELPFESLAYLMWAAEDQPKLHKICLHPMRNSRSKVEYWLGYGREIAEDADAQMLRFLQTLMF
jgi:DNA-binding CsgD family transcriptional regulator